MNNRKLSELFEVSTYPSVLFRPSSQVDHADVLKVLEYIGNQDEIISIRQPVGSAEVSSQNFTIVTAHQLLQLRRCKLFKGVEKHGAMVSMLNTLAADGVHVPQFDYPSDKILKDNPYFEIDGKGWTFYKYIDAKAYFPGVEGIAKVAYLLGKLHVCLKKKYGNQNSLPQDSDSAYVNFNLPYFPRSAWLHFQNVIAESIDGETVYGPHKKLISTLVTIVEDGFSCLQDPDDIQNIHFDLNAGNILFDKNETIFIMDFDTTKLGNIYNDLGMLFARALTVCIERGQVTEENFNSQLVEFINNYSRANPELKFDINKFIIALYDRALCNVHAGMRFKYNTKDSPWTAGIRINLKRLEQVHGLVQLVMKSELYKKSRPQSALTINSFWSQEKFASTSSFDNTKAAMTLR